MDVQTLKPYCTCIDGNVAVVVFGNELDELMDCAVDGGDPFWYVMGTDAWFEAQTVNGVQSLVACSHDKTYLHCPISDEMLSLLGEDAGVLVVISDVLLKPQDIKQTSDLDELRAWMDSEVGEDSIDGLIFCFYTEEDKKHIYN